MIRDNSQPTPDPDDQVRRQEEVQAQNAAAGVAAQQAHQGIGELQTAEFLDKLRDPEVDTSSFGNLSDILGPELSGVQMLANETDEDYQRHLWLNENRARQVIHERKAGRLCQGPFLALAQRRNGRPGQGAHGDLTEDEKRKVLEALATVKTSRQSLGKGSRGLRAVAESTAVSRVERSDEQNDDSRARGALQRVFR